MSIETYIHNEFARYYPNADIRVRCDDETILVSVRNIGEYRFDAGSDDDYYTFARTDTMRACVYITIPLQPE